MTPPNTPTDMWTKIDALCAHLTLIQKYTELITEIEKRSAPNNFHDRKLRLQMTTLMSRPSSLYALIMIYLASRAIPEHMSHLKRGLPNDRRGPLTKARLAHALWQRSSLKHKTLEPVRAQIVQAGRIIDAAIAFGLAEPAQAPDRKQRPASATPDLENLIRLLSFQLARAAPDGRPLLSDRLQCERCLILASCPIDQLENIGG